MLTLKKHYFDTGAGQIHARVMPASGAERKPPLLCLHPAPYSGLYYETVMPLINTGRRVIAPDYPGYGNSYALSEPPAIENYAAAMITGILERESDPVDLLGFHSGCLVAAEIALCIPTRIRHLLLIDAPYFDRETQQNYYPKVAKPLALDRDIGCVKKAWDFNVGNRDGVVPIDRSLAMFVDNLQSGSNDYYCFHAAFTYDCVEQFARVTTPTTFIATQSSLRDATHAAAKAIANAALIDEQAIATSVFEQGAERIASHICRVLDDA